MSHAFVLVILQRFYRTLFLCNIYFTMNSEHRKRIDLYCDIIVPKLNIMKLWPKLLENGIFNIDDINISTWKRNFDKEETVKSIWLTIKTRGPFAFQNLLLSLQQSDHEELAEMLDKRTDENTEINDNYFSRIKDTAEPLQIKVRKAKEFSSGPINSIIKTYRMRSNPRGLVLIITNIDYNPNIQKSRKSAIHDEINLQKLFEEMGFSVETYSNLTGQQIIDRVKTFSQRKDLQNVDSCFVIISSHGKKGEENYTEIEGVDHYYERKYTKVFCSDIIDCFTSEACPYLAEKPKVFIFQLCRGDKRQTITHIPEQVTDSSDNHTVMNNPRSILKEKPTRNYSDFLIAYATLPGYVAFRNNITGSWFIQIFCEVFMNYAHDHHLCDLLKLVDSRLKNVTHSGGCQTVVVETKGFHKYCFLNPGFFGNEKKQ
ncbi:caspase Dronc-like [Vespula pensylvanica]|uniref:caspase Dronc-like n=1 Tax=Vespula pensylvanica TaxID=30213 RepID=UPI001CB9FCFC|nr:caspase Dronc-like [Vespula pensylvanica]